MTQGSEELIQIGVFVVLIILTMFTGTIGEKRHYASIKKRELSREIHRALRQK